METKTKTKLHLSWKAKQKENKVFEVHNIWFDSQEDNLDLLYFKLYIYITFSSFIRT
jgi:hypothetical protein